MYHFRTDCTEGNPLKVLVTPTMYVPFTHLSKLPAECDEIKQQISQYDTEK